MIAIILLSLRPFVPPFPVEELAKPAGLTVWRLPPRHALGDGPASRILGRRRAPPMTFLTRLAGKLPTHFDRIATKEGFKVAPQARFNLKSAG